MAELIASKTVTARVEHRCELCMCVAVHPGEKYRRDTLVYDGRAYVWIQCAECDAMMPIVWEWAYRPDEGINWDTYVEWARDHKNDETHGQMARDYLARLRASGRVRIEDDD